MKGATKRKRIREAIDAMPTHDRFRCQDLKRWLDKKYRAGGLCLSGIGMVLLHREFDDVRAIGKGWYQKEMEI